MEILETLEKFGTQAQCVSHLEKTRWGDRAICPYCSSARSSNRKNVLRRKCLDCNSSFSVLVGTIMESTKLPLPKWFLAMSLILNAKKGISSLQLARDIGVNKNTAWYLQKRIRQAMNEDNDILKGIIETDESYIGGSLTHRHERDIPQIGNGTQNAGIGDAPEKGKNSGKGVKQSLGQGNKTLDEKDHRQGQ